METMKVRPNHVFVPYRFSLAYVIEACVKEAQYIKNLISNEAASNKHLFLTGHVLILHPAVSPPSTRGEQPQRPQTSDRTATVSIVPVCL